MMRLYWKNTFQEMIDDIKGRNSDLYRIVERERKENGLYSSKMTRYVLMDMYGLKYEVSENDFNVNYVTEGKLMRYPEYINVLIQCGILALEGTYTPSSYTGAKAALAHLEQNLDGDIEKHLSDNRREVNIFRVDTEKLDDFQRFLGGCAAALALVVKPIPLTE
ncbi:MAG: hypothetical protein V1802_01820 [Candidatus Aenigmatarchaeota archaeon]